MESAGVLLWEIDQQSIVSWIPEAVHQWSYGLIAICLYVHPRLENLLVGEMTPHMGRGLS